jgi:diguanylate cyclase (GGDEF)-like protein
VVQLILVAALVAALLTVSVASVAAARARARVERQIEQALGDLTTALGSVGELAASLDVAEVMQRTLAAVSALPGIDGGVLSVEGPDGERTRVVLGVSEEEAARAALEAPATELLRATQVVYGDRLNEAEKAVSFVRGGLVVPLVADGDSVGTLTAFTRSPSKPFPEETIAALERLASRAGPALDNAQRFAEARRLADIDSLTGLHNRRCFHELLAREVARAHRYDRRLALILFDLDNFKTINDRIGHLTGDVVLAEVGSRVLGVARAADIACRVGGDEFGVIMPETSIEDAEHLANRIAETVGERPIGQGHTLYVSAGVAELREEDDPNALFERADDALYQAKHAGKARTIAAS